MKYLHFDLRALGLMRLCVASVVLFDLSIRMTDLEAFYADTGAVPLSLIFQHAWNDYFISLHTISGLWQVQLFLFILAWFFGIMLFIGYRTRLFTVLSWFMMLSLHNRNSLILQGGDDFLRMILFWAMFIPWGARYSCDAILGPSPSNEKQICTVACVAYLLQLSYLYTGSALLKGPEWNTHYNAMYYVYALDQIAFPVTKHFFYNASLLSKLTFLAYYFELLVPLLFFIPFLHQWFRTAGVLLIIAFHSINALTLFIGLFPLIGITTSLGLLPASAMDFLENKFSALRKYAAVSFRHYASYIACLIPWRQPTVFPGLWQLRMQTAALVFLLIFVFDWNLSNLSFIESKLSDRLRFIGYTLRLDQNWGMFAPGVFKDDGWFVMQGVTEKKETVNLFGFGKECGFTRPADITGLFKNDRWRKYSENMILAYNSFMRGYFCNYYKRIWNESHTDKKINALQVIFMSEFTLPEYRYSKPVKEVLWECD